MRLRLASALLAFGLLVAIACLMLAPRAQAAGTLVQTTNASNGGATSVSATYASSVTANNLLVAICGVNSAAATITGPSGFTTARNDASTATTPGQGIFYKIAAGTETSISCSASASVSLGIQIYEYSGMAASRPLDATNTTASSGAVGLSAASGNVTTTYANDLLLAGITANGGTTISSWSNSFVQENSFAITAGKTSLRTTWGGADFSVGATGTYSTAATLGVSTAWVGQIAAFRVNTPSTSTLSVDMVNGSGTPIGSPAATLSSATTSFSCGTVTGALSTSSQKIRITNSTTNPAWSISVGATSGAAALWSDGASPTPHTYDFNDAGGSGCTDSDSDGKAGMLTLSPSSISATSQTGCTTTGLTLLAAATGFTATNSITLASAANASTTDTACYWDVSGINLSQTIPPGQHSGTYGLNLTITVVAN